MAVNKRSSQKFIARNRAPRVQIEYDVEIYGSEKRSSCLLLWGSWLTCLVNPLSHFPA